MNGKQKQSLTLCRTVSTNYEEKEMHLCHSKSSTSLVRMNKSRGKFRSIPVPFLFCFLCLMKISTVCFLCITLYTRKSLVELNRVPHQRAPKQAFITSFPILLNLLSLENISSFFIHKFQRYLYSNNAHSVVVGRGCNIVLCLCTSICL